VGLRLRNLGTGLVAACIGAAVLASGACAAGLQNDTWFPHPAGAKWQYRWSDNVYNAAPGTTENVDVEKTQGDLFTLAWADPADSIPVAGASLSCSSTSDLGTVTLQETDQGLVSASPYWTSCAAPAGTPLLCGSADSCYNNLSSSLLSIIWGDSSAVLQEPLLQGTTWSATSIADSYISSTSRYLGLQKVVVPAYPKGVVAAVVQTQIIQTDGESPTYGTGMRTVWWVDGVGPVQVVFNHAGDGADAYGRAPTTKVQLLSTNLVAKQPESDIDYFPLKQGLTNTYSWTNSKHLPQPEVEAVTSQVSGSTVGLTVKSVSGPMTVAGDYVLTLGLDGLTNLGGSSAARTLLTFPALGHGRHFLTPLDLMVFGFNPVLPAYAQDGETWKSGNASDFAVYGVTGSTRVIGVTTVHVPAGTFHALEVRSVLTQRGHRFGSGVRTSWFAPGRGLVKLVFRHDDGSVSLVQLVKNK
jgi:hypothetical protein